MKKLTVLLILSLILVTAVSAVSQPKTALVIPYDGISGIPTGSNYYDSETSGEWAYGAPNGSKIGASKKTSSRSNYTDTEMVGIIMFLNSSDTIQMNGGTITVTATCPNGFYLVSESNPNYKRPFEIMLFDSWNAAGKKGWKIAENESTKTISVPSVYGKTYYAGEAHFDVVIRLPGKTNYETDECTCDGKIYPLGDFSDYSAVVTFNVEYTPSGSTSPTITKTVTIPFSGYYTGNDPYVDEDTTNINTSVSMSILLNSEAYNIDIKSKLGKTINIGSIYFNMMVGTSSDYADVNSTYDNCAIFFSSSSDAYDSGATKFKLVKDDVGANDPLTSINSVGFKLTVTSSEDKSSVTFDGTTYFKDPTGTGSEMTTLSGSAGDRKKSTQVISSDSYIIPNLYKEYMKSNSRTYYSYSGSIQLTLDDNVVTMLSGRYVETVYIHVMSYK